MVPRRGTGIVRTRGGEGSGRRSGGGGGDGGGGIARERKSLLSPTERTRDKPKRGREGKREGERKRENWTTMTVAAAAVRRRVGQHRADTEKKRATTSLRVSWRAWMAFTRKPTTPPPSTPLFPRRHSSNPFEIDRSAVDRSIVRSLGSGISPIGGDAPSRMANASGPVRTNARGSEAFTLLSIVYSKNYQLSAFASPLCC